MSRRPLWGYLTAQAVSLTGTRVSMIAIPWFVLTTTGSATRTGLVAFAEMGPLVLMQVLSGPLIDRLGARRVAIGCDLASVAAVGLVPALHLTHLLSFGTLLALVAVAGSLRGPGDAAKHALMPQVAEHTGARMEGVTGLDGAVERTASLVGAAAGAGLVSLLGAANALALDAASFLVSAIVLAGSLPAVVRVAGRARTTATDYLSDLRSGWSFLRRDAVLMGIGVMVAVTNLLDQAFTAVLLPVWARHSGYGVAAVGIFSATFAGTAILGSVVAARYGDRLPRFKVYLVGFLLAGVPRFAVLALGAPLWLVLPVAVVGGVGCGFLNPILGAVMFERIPKPLLGRVSAMGLAMSWSLIPFGGLLGGVAVAGVGIAPALLAVGAAYFAATMLPALRPSFRQMDRAGVPRSAEARENVPAA